MQGDFLNTIFALIFAIVVVAVLWGLANYFGEMGSEEAKRENKSLIINSTSWLLALMVIFALVEWLRAYIGI